MSETPIDEIEQPETQIIPPQYDPPTPVPYNEWRVISAELGDMLCVPADSDIPNGWLKCESREITRDEYPEFFAKMDVADTTQTLTLPEAFNTEIQMFIIKMKQIDASSPE